MQKLKDKRQGLWEVDKGTEGEKILEYDNEAKKRESLWQKDKPILSFAVLHPNRPLIKGGKTDSAGKREGRERSHVSVPLLLKPSS